MLIELFSLTAYGPSGSRGTNNLCIILCPDILLIYNSPVPIFSPLWRDTERFKCVFLKNSTLRPEPRPLHSLSVQGRSQDFSKGGHTGSNNIVMAFSPRNIVGCLLKKRLTKGGHVHPRTPPSYALAVTLRSLHLLVLL